ncbi:MAG: hypothetical protein NC204_07155 [Candidatus Amulumruptor caecigallinarius]|nr:hypothetical protein [Candidatus Amulumruptor caecigallinarius]
MEILTGDKFRLNIEAVIDEFIDTQEAYEDAVLAIDDNTLETRLMEETEAEATPDISYYDMMDFVGMSSGGEWLIDSDSVDSVVEEYFPLSD